MSIPLAVPGDITGTSRVAAAIETLLPASVRHRQLPVRTLLTGMMLTLDDRRPAYLTEVHAALTALPEPDQARLGVTETWKTGPHQLTYRQAGHTFRLAVKALSKKHPDGAPSDALAGICDDLLEASPRRAQGHLRRLVSGLDRRGDLVPAAAARHHRVRRPRGGECQKFGLRREALLVRVEVRDLRRWPVAAGWCS